MTTHTLAARVLWTTLDRGPYEECTCGWTGASFDQHEAEESR
jgi:hypothetical protein